VNPSGRSREERLKALRELIQASKRLELPQVRSDINVTPLVDVVLVLLIIFMVVTPLIASGVAVDLPRTIHHSRRADEGRDIIISITQDERVYVGANRLGKLEDLARAVRSEKQRNPNKTIFLKGDARASFGAVREAMEVLRESEIEDITLGTEEQNPIQ
jgi:biopolymer transport protein ExbD/biopolymer transport protein TolR